MPATNDSFKVSKSAGATTFKVDWARPNSLDAGEWELRIGGDHTEKVEMTVSKVVAAALNELAAQKWVIACQAAVRSEAVSQERAQKAVDAYKYGAPRVQTVVQEVKTVDCKDLPFITATMAAEMIAGGYKVLNAPEGTLEALKEIEKKAAK